MPTSPPQNQAIFQKNFDGTISDWLNYLAIFNYAVHRNKSMSKVKKYTVLRGYLKDHAPSLAETLHITDDNYVNM